MDVSGMDIKNVNILFYLKPGPYGGKIKLLKPKSEIVVIIKN
jgi:hypothetical protein